MKTTRILVLLTTLALAACGGDPPEGATGAAVAPETRFVDNLPTYESVPLPEGLTWVTNEADPVFASTEAKRGGTFRSYLTSFPLTLRMYGPDSSSGEFVAMKRATFLSLVDLHPNTLNFIPSLATHWAFDPDGKTVYYRLDPRARWSDGVPVTADDYVFAKDFRRSEHIVDPYGQNYFTNVVVDVRKHDDYTISVVGAAPKPQNELPLQYSVGPVARHFHKLDANWVQDYNWRIEPNTGPYQISGLENGRYIEFTRKQDWWGDELLYNRNRFNVDRVRLDIIRDENVAWEYFMRGEIDTFVFATSPARWYERARGEPFDRGYIGKIQFYTDLPRNPRGLWLNMDDPLLADRNVRYGIAHSINMDRVLTSLFRGDYERLNQHFEDYYWGYSNPDLRPREFDLAKADQYLAAAGWTQRGADGIRTKGQQRLAVTISYGTDEHTPWLVVLREEARKAGVELNLQLLDPATWGTQVGEKKFQIVFLTFGSGLVPTFWQHYHSDNAHKPQTNNLTGMDDPEIDKLIDAFEAAAGLEERVALSHRIQALAHEYSAFIPTYKIPYLRETFWRWVRLPDHHGTRTSTEIFDPFGAGLFWIDEDVRAETRAAQAGGRSLEPIDIVDATWRTD